MSGALLRGQRCKRPAGRGARGRALRPALKRKSPVIRVLSDFTGLADVCRPRRFQARRVVSTEPASSRTASPPYRNAPGAWEGKANLFWGKQGSPALRNPRFRPVFIGLNRGEPPPKRRFEGSPARVETP